MRQTSGCQGTRGGGIGDEAKAGTLNERKVRGARHGVGHRRLWKAGVEMS